jgi:hypothetical protein
MPDWGAITNVALSGAMVALVIFCIWYAIKLWNYPSMRPIWFVNIINSFYPVSYMKLANSRPYTDSNTNVRVDTTSKTSNTCSISCGDASDCNGYMFNTQNNVCTHILDDFGTLIMIPGDSLTSNTFDTYIKSDKNLPKWGFISLSLGTDFAYNSNVVSQRINATAATGTDSALATIDCIKKSSSNCVAVSIDTVNKNYYLVNNSNTSVYSNVQSYQLGLIPTSYFASVQY